MTTDFSGTEENWPNDVEYGAVLCGECGTLMRAGEENEETEAEVICPGCGSKSRQRKKDSLCRTWALTTAALILYIPANILPMMDVQIFGQSDKNTIIGGVIQLFELKMYFICFVVFTASFVVPIFKISSLYYILFSLGKRSKLTNLQKTRLFSIVEFTGKWSMLDVYVVAVMAGLINTGFFIKTTGGYGLIFFGLVVVLTMLASQSFDTRLIWDER